LLRLRHPDMDYLLRTDTEQEMTDALEAAGLLYEQDVGGGEVVLYFVDRIGYSPIGPVPAVIDEDGETILTPGDSRYHANLRVLFDLTPQQIAALPTFTPLPSVPYRVFI
jgi:hypothetical protein